MELNFALRVMRIFGIPVLCLLVTSNVKSQKICAASNKTVFFADNIVKNEGIRGCVASCLGLLNAKKPCTYNEKSGNAMKEPCEVKFLPARKDKIILCSDFEQSEYFPYEKSTSLTACDFFAFHIVRYDQKGELVPLRADDVNVRQQLEEFRRLGIKRILTLGSVGNFIMGPDLFNSVAENTTLRLKFADSLNRTMHKYKLDGVFIKWMWPGCIKGDCGIRAKNKTIMNVFAKDVFLPLRNQGLKIFFFIHVESVGIMVNYGDFYSEISPFVDYFPINSNAQGGNSWENTELSNNLKKTKDTLAVLFKAVADKTFMDKVLYEISPEVKTYEFKNPNSKEKLNVPKNKDSKIPSFFSFEEVCGHFQNGSFTFVKNATTQSYAYFGNMFLPYDDSTSLKAKADFMRERGSGFFISQIRADIFGGKCANCGNMHFTRVAAEYLKGGDCVVSPLCF